MDWALENWFWILIFVVFVSIHLFGRGGHRNHSDGHKNTNKNEKDEVQNRPINTHSGEHQN